MDPTHLTGLASHSIAVLQALFRSGELSPVELARFMLERIDVVEPRINAFSQRNPELTLARARASEKRWMDGTPNGPLDGIPFSIKDTLVAQGFASRKGSRVTSEAPATDSSPVVDRLLEQGAVPLGITTTPEFGGGPVTISPLTGITRNAWNPAMTAGGSSGGAAASMACGVGSIALATDAGGSIRTPAALNGVFGFKPTGNRVPAYPPNVAGALSCPGVITRSVEDAAYAMSVITRPDMRDPEAAPGNTDDYLERLGEGIAGLRVAVSPKLGFAREVDPEVAERFDAAVETFARLGARVEEADPPFPDPMDIYKTLFTSGYAFSLSRLSDSQLACIGPALRELVEQGQRVTLDAYLLAQERRRTLARTMRRFHERYDLLLTPSVAVPAFPAERWQPEHFEKYGEPRSWVPFGYTFNLSQQPAASVPCGMTKDGLPIGLQIVGRQFDDALVLRAAWAFESLNGGPRTTPRVNA